MIFQSDIAQGETLTGQRQMREPTVS